MLAALPVVVLAYVLGSIPTGVLLSRALGGRDVREHGSGNIGAANVARTSGFRVGALVGLIDIMKGVAAVVIGRLAGVNDTALAIVAVASVLGHDYSLFLRFRGVKGVATTLGAVLALAPVAAVLAMVGWLLIFLRFRYSSLASLVALGLPPILLFVMQRPAPYVTAGLFLLVLGGWKHRDNIARLLAGKETKFGRPGSSHGP
jgi:glycerol-3-phosphate acyltransferase PlsY